MISKVAEQHPRSWHRYIGMILFALRESVNETTGVAPYTLVYGRLPLAVLKNTWINENDFPARHIRMSLNLLMARKEFCTQIICVNFTLGHRV